MVVSARGFLLGAAMALPLAVAGAPPDSELPGLPGLYPQTRPPAPSFAKTALASTPANLDFEAIGTDGLPTGWTPLGDPIVRVEGSNHYIHINNRNLLRQSITPNFRRRHQTISLLARGEFGVEGVVLRQEVFASTHDIYSQTRYFLDGTSWQRLYATQPILGDSQTLVFDAFGLDAYNWVDVDDFAFLDEGLVNGNFEAPLDSAMLSVWQLADGAAIVADSTLEPLGASALQLPPGASASQFTAAAFDEQQYFIAGTARAISTPGSLDTKESWRDGHAAELSAAAETQAISTASTDFLFVGGNEEDVQLSSVSLRNIGASTLVLDKIDRGFTRAFPATYTPGANSVHPKLELTAAWPGRLSTAVVEIHRVSPASLIDTLSLALADGTAYAEWDGISAAPDNYIARFLLTDGSGRTLQIDRSFTLVPGPEMAAPQPLLLPGIQRGAWIWLYNDTDNLSDLRPIFAQAQQDGFTFAVVFGRTSQWAAVQAACEELQFPFMLGDAATHSAIRHIPGLATFDAATFVDTVESTVGPSFSSPQCMGFYLVDEPEADPDVARAVSAVRIAARQSTWKPPFLTISTVAGFNTRFQSILPPVYWTDTYPFTLTTAADSEARLAEVATHIESTVAAARAQGRDYWLVGQAFTDQDFYRFGGAPTVRASIGTLLAMGAKGYVPFIYRQITSLDGIRKKDLGALPETSEWIAQNNRVEAGETALAELTNHTKFASAAGPIIASIATAPDTSKVLFIVNRNTRQGVRVNVSFNASPMLTELTNGSTIQTVSGAASFDLAPGDWRAYRFAVGNLVSAGATAYASDKFYADLPVVADWTLDTGAVRDLAFDSAGTRILAAGSSRAIVRTLAGVETARPSVRSGYAAAFALDDTALVSDTDQGLVAFTPSGASLPGYLRFTGTSTAVLADASVTWNAISYFGLRLLDNTGSGAFSLRDVAIGEDFVTDLAGPFSGGGVLFSQFDRGIWRAVPQSPSGITTNQEWQAERTWRTSLSPNAEHLAVARLQRGLALVELAPDGAIVDTNTPATDTFVVEQVAWVRDDLLAVSDTSGDVVLYSVRPGLEVFEMARWRDASAARTITALASKNEKLAVAYGDGRVQVLELSGMDFPAAAERSWLTLP